MRPAVLAFLFVAFATAATAQTGIQHDVVFDQYTPLTDNHELLRRLLPRDGWQTAEDYLAKSGQNLQAQSIDLSKEHFVVYVPSTPPPAAGYGLMVFVPPWDEAGMPDGWQSVFDAHHMIYVSAAQSGNDQTVSTRRVPLAVLAEVNVAKRYPIDPARVYVGGFSGGSRVALRVAVAYPDLFAGAFLNAGADPIGSKRIPVPPDELLARFQENTRVYFAIGAQDIGNLTLEGGSLRSMNDYCVFNVRQKIVPDVMHDVASANVLDEALDYLDTPPVNDAAQLSSCRAARH